MQHRSCEHRRHDAACEGASRLIPLLHDVRKEAKIYLMMEQIKILNTEVSQVSIVSRLVTPFTQVRCTKMSICRASHMRCLDLYNSEAELYE